MLESNFSIQWSITIYLGTNFYSPKSVWMYISIGDRNLNFLIIKMMSEYLNEMVYVNDLVWSLCKRSSLKYLDQLDTVGKIWPNWSVNT